MVVPAAEPSARWRWLRLGLLRSGRSRRSRRRRWPRARALRLGRRGWLLAAISQGLVVATGLWLYAEYEPPYVYPIMAYAVLMILYLNSHDVRTIFLPREDSEASYEA